MRQLENDISLACTWNSRRASRIEAAMRYILRPHGPHASTFSQISTSGAEDFYKADNINIGPVLS